MSQAQIASLDVYADVLPLDANVVVEVSFPLWFLPLNVYCFLTKNMLIIASSQKIISSDFSKMPLMWEGAIASLLLYVV